MHFDTVTLMMVGSITTAISAVVLLGVWLQMRRATALLWWFAANAIYAISIALLVLGLVDGYMPMVIAGAMLNNLVPPLIWIGTRVFNRRPTSAPLAALAIGVWLVGASTVTAMSHSLLVAFVGVVCWLGVSAFELWRGRAEGVPARWPLIVFLLIHASVYLGGVYDTLEGSFALNGIVPLNSWFGAILLEGILYAMASAILMPMMCKERETQTYIRAARNDSLTGIANHGALLENAERLFARCRKDATPFSLIMFDLDHFKIINDRHGHRAGDDILRAFVETVHGLLRPTDLFGRYGGEEFTVVLPGATLETAQVIAERVRHAFAEHHRFLDGQPLNATVSAGIAEAGATMSLEDTIDAADRAMYRAKDLGRNRVERAGRQLSENGGSIVIRVA